MKVVKPGAGWSIEATCTGKGWNDGGCGAELLVEKDDLFRSTVSQMGRDTCSHVLFRCCQCGVRTSLGNSDDAVIKVPWSFLRTLPTYREWAAKQGEDQPA